ncbi:MAG: carboxypeptidase regulatory-like domain-containing protein, partial [Ignavibacteriales bacterium]|nr:carboxypeptidase regulatory-like domain-containing protein [Ignavibacteriales bacterium]
MFKKFFLFLFSLQLLYATALLGGSVRGNVTNQEGTAINGASVSLSNESHTFRATTQWNGGYQFSRIPAGTYSLSATAWNYQPYTHSEQVVLEETTRVSGLNITMSPAVANASLSGIVTNSASSNPIAGAVIRVSRNHHGGDSGNVATTDANGNYSIENIFPGTYSVFCEAEGYYSNSTWNVSIATGSMLDIQLLERLEGTVSGTVTRDGSGEPVGFAFLEFIPADSSRHWRFNHSVTDSLGNYSAELPVGDYYVSCKIGNGGHHGPQYREFYDNAQTISEATVVTVSDDQTTGNINFGIPSPQEIGIVVSGKVSDYNNVPLAGAKVRVWPFARHMRRDSLFTVTDAEGNYSISISRVTMNNVRFLVSAKMQGYAVEYYQEKTSWHTADVFTVNSDTSFASVDFTLDTATVGSTNSISGIITNAQGAPLQNAFVHGYARHSRRAAH